MLLERLITLIEKFETEHYLIPVSTPLKMLKHFIKARRSNKKISLGLSALEAIASEVVNRKRDMSKAQASARAACLCRCGSVDWVMKGKG